jgi:hypothetical protein
MKMQPCMKKMATAKDMNWIKAKKHPKAAILSLKLFLTEFVPKMVFE